jgi:hypothetical protein
LVDTQWVEDHQRDENVHVAEVDYDRQSNYELGHVTMSKEWYSMKLDLLINATVVNDTIRFVIEKQYFSFAETKSKTNDAAVIEANEGSIKEKPLTTINQVF